MQTLMDIQQPRLGGFTFGAIFLSAGSGIIGALMLALGAVVIIAGGSWLIAALGAALLAVSAASFVVARKRTRRALRAWSDDVRSAARASGISDIDALLSRMKPQAPR